MRGAVFKTPQAGRSKSFLVLFFQKRTFLFTKKTRVFALLPGVALALTLPKARTKHLQHKIRRKKGFS